MWSGLHTAWQLGFKIEHHKRESSKKNCLRDPGTSYPLIVHPLMAHAIEVKQYSQLLKEQTQIAIQENSHKSEYRNMET